MLAAAAKEPAGMWFGEGLSMLGIEPGSEATEAQVRAVLGRLEHPTRVDMDGKPVPLGSRPRTFRSPEDRAAQALAAEPDASEERRAEIHAQVHARTRKAVAFYDFTFSPVKSVSVYWTALMEAGRFDEAANVVAAHRAGVAAAMAYVEREAGYVRSGFHGKTLSGQSVGVYEQTRGLAWIRWDHSTSRAQQPHLHSHVTVPNRAESVVDGQIRALASRGFKPIKQGAEAIYRRESERALTAANGIVFATREDGKAREILGFSPQLLAKASARSIDVRKRRDILIATFEEAYGRAPSPVERKQIDQTAWRDTRQAKNHAVAPDQQRRNWARPLRAELDGDLAAADEHGTQVAREGHPDEQGYTSRSREALLNDAVRTVQGRYAVWDVGNLVAAIVDEQARTPAIAEPAEELAAAVLVEGDRYGVTLLSLRDVGTVPVELRRADGVNRYRLKNELHYATTEQLATETTIVARARSTGARTVAGPVLELVQVELQAARLSPDQRDAVIQILTSGRRGDVLIGPAGAGKSRTVGALSRVWRSHVGGRVLGLATSQKATQILVDDGVFALNTTVFRNRFTPATHGRALDQLVPNDLVILDEAGMTSTDDLAAISALVAAAGAKLVYTGDPEQLAAVGAGGMLDLLVRDAGAIQLGTVHRFTHAWERAASVRLRAGDVDVLAVYDAHGRIRGGTEQEMTAAAVRGYLADVLEGHSSVLVVRDNASAAELSGQIHAELVAAGRVAAEVLAEDMFGNPVGTGDLLQARRNDYRLRVHGGRPVTNREVYEVLNRNRLTGALTVRDRDGIRAHLPAAYVRAHTTLAYAVTAYGAQGMTIYSSHNLLGRGAGRPDVYVPGTRGTDDNTFYVICRSDPDHHDPERLDSTPVVILADALDRAVDARTASELARRAGVEEGQSLSWVGTQWDLLTAELGRADVTATLTALLPAHVAAAILDEPGYHRLVSAVRLLELHGHDAHALLAEAITRGTLHDAHSVSDVLRYRMRRLDHDGRIPERAVRGGDWTTYTTGRGGPVGDYIQVLAAAAGARQIELGERAAAAAPAWALAAPALGPVPPDPRQRREWVRRAGIVAAYRDLHAVPENQQSIGPAPSRERAFHHTLWRQAQAALGHPADTLDYTTATTAQLREMRDAWRRAQIWAPAYVADELHIARRLAEEYRRDAVIWRTALNCHPEGSPQRALEERDVAAAERLTAVHTARVAALEQIQAVRTDWHNRHRDTEQRARFAADELERRGLDRDTVAPVGEQRALFELPSRDSNRHATAQGAEASRADQNAPLQRADVDRGRVPAPAQHELDLDGVPRRQTAADVDAAVEPTRAGAGANTGARRSTDPDPATTACGTDRVTPASARATSPVDRGADRAAQTVPDGYAALFDQARREAERAAVQPALFETEPVADDIAAAQSLRTGEPDDRDAASTSPVRAAGSAGAASGDDTAADPVVTVGQARRDAEIIASLRDRIAARAAVEAARLRGDPDGDDHGQGYDDGYGSGYGVDSEGDDEDYGRASREASSSASAEKAGHAHGMST